MVSTYLFSFVYNSSKTLIISFVIISLDYNSPMQ